MFLRDEEDKADVVLVDCKFPVKAHLYVIAETAYGSLIYQVSISDGKFFCHDKVLEPQRNVNSFITKKSRMDDPPSCHFVHQEQFFYVISSASLKRMDLIDVHHNTQRTIETNRPKVFFTAVFLVGRLVIGIGHTLKDVCIMKKKRWKHLDTSGSSLDQTRKIEISGWAVLNSDTFIVADTKAYDCFILNLTMGEWNVVKPRLPYRCGMLCGRSFCVGGFIYTPWKGGIIAFELVEDGNFYYLGEPILFGLWKKKIYGSWRRISLDEKFNRIALISTDSDCIVFSMFHGAPSAPPFRGVKHDVLMTTVLVKTQTTGRGTKQPISAEHIDLCTSFIEHEGWINPTLLLLYKHARA